MANRPGFAVAMSRTLKLPDETTMDFMRTFDCDPPTSL